MEHTYESIYKEYYLNEKNIPAVIKMHEAVLEAKADLIKDLGGLTVEVPFIDELVRKKAILRLLKLRLNNKIDGSRLPCNVIWSFTSFLALFKFVCQSNPIPSAPIFACFPIHWPPPLVKTILGILSKPRIFRFEKLQSKST